MQVIGIKRAVKHSPNHINNDATIFQMVADLLKENGAVLTTYHEHEFLKAEHATDAFKDTRLIFSMSRNPEVLSRLKSIQKTYGQQIAMLNSPEGIEHCFRSNITRILLDNSIATAPSLIIPTKGYNQTDLERLDQGHGLWLKRGDFHAIIKEDVVFARNPEEAVALLAAFKARNIAEVVASSHLAGDLIKFYGVSGTDFFHWLYPYEKGHYKYKEFEAINGATKHFKFNQSALHELADKAAVAAQVPIYGGDAVIDAAGQISIIDFNDWPSFAPCRKQAAAAIHLRLRQALAPVSDRQPTSLHQPKTAFNQSSNGQKTISAGTPRTATVVAMQEHTTRSQQRPKPVHNNKAADK